MIRFAKESDLPQILEIYGPYVLNTAVSFEYTVPSLEEFTQRFRISPGNSPGWYGKKMVKSWGILTEVCPLVEPPTAGVPPVPSILHPRHKAGASVKNSTPPWKIFYKNRATGRPMPLSPPTIPALFAFMRRLVFVLLQSFRIAV